MVNENKVPRHVSIILDGNGRWAQKRGRERTYGHRIGAKNVKKIVQAAAHRGIHCLTLYAFSTENWKRPAPEVKFLMHLFKDYLISQLRELVKDNVQVHIIGDVSVLSKSLQEGIRNCEKDTATNDGLILNVAINYGGRSELVRAIKHMAADVKADSLELSDISEEIVSKYLYPSASSDVDLFIRTGGDIRISNFLLWQISYSELYFTPVLWPDFTEEELDKALEWFAGRDRRFGGLTEEHS